MVLLVWISAGPAAAEGTDTLEELVRSGPVLRLVALALALPPERPTGCAPVTRQAVVEVLGSLGQQRVTGKVADSVRQLATDLLSPMVEANMVSPMKLPMAQVRTLE